MAGRRIHVLDIREMVRRFKLGHCNRQVARELSSDRRTVSKYRKLAEEVGWLTRPELPTPAEIESRLVLVTNGPEPGPISRVEPYRARVQALRESGVEMMAIWQILKDESQFAGSYSSVRRFVRHLSPPTVEPCVRVETPPGVEAQVDFGYAGVFADPVTGETHRAWAFVMTLCYSRHMYVEIVFDQTVSTWLALHIRAFEYFGAVPARIVPDNLKALAAAPGRAGPRSKPRE
jgi:transposase